MAQNTLRRNSDYSDFGTRIQIVATAVVDERGNLHTLNDATQHGVLVDHLLETGKIRYRSAITERGFLLSDGSFCSRKKAALLMGKPNGSLCYSSDVRGSK